MKLCEYCGKNITRVPTHSKDHLRFCNQSCITAWVNKRRARSDVERFWSRVSKTPTCWIWQGAPRAFGYGRIDVDGVSVSTHRFSWQLHYGTIPNGFSVLHKCDIPLCVNPEHLFLGTQLDNMRDRRRKGR